MWLVTNTGVRFLPFEINVTHWPLLKKEIGGNFSETRKIQICALRIKTLVSFDSFTESMQSASHNGYLTR